MVGVARSLCSTSQKVYPAHNFDLSCFNNVFLQRILKVASLFFMFLYFIIWFTKSKFLILEKRKVRNLKGCGCCWDESQKGINFLPT